VTRHESTGRIHDPPPRQIEFGGSFGQDPTHEARLAWMTGGIGHFTVRDDFTFVQRHQHRDDVGLTLPR